MKNVHIVLVCKYSENRTITVADKLVIYDPAKKKVTPKMESALNKGVYGSLLLHRITETSGKIRADSSLPLKQSNQSE